MFILHVQAGYMHLILTETLKFSHSCLQFTDRTARPRGVMCLL